MVQLTCGHQVLETEKPQTNQKHDGLEHLSTENYPFERLTVVCIPKHLTELQSVLERLHEHHKEEAAENKVVKAKLFVLRIQASSVANLYEVCK